MRIICSKYNISKGGCIVAYNGLAALKLTYAARLNKVNPNSIHCDIISALSRIREGMMINLKYKHVKGHSDTMKSAENFPGWRI